MKYYLFIDETGDHGLSFIDENFPIFMLIGVLVSENEYNNLNKNINNFKEYFFNTKEVILHSSDIRKINPPFQILFNLDVKKDFYEKLDGLISNVDCRIIPVGIMKDNYVKKYGKTASDPYALSLSFLLERLVFDCEKISDCNEVEIIIEKRGKREDVLLLSHYQKIVGGRGTYYVKSDRFNRIISKFDFKSKADNDNGLQVADLMAYPIAKYILSKKAPNKVFDLISSKIRRNGEIKIFP